MTASNYQPNKTPMLLMNSDTNFFTHPTAADFDTLFRQTIVYPFDTMTVTKLDASGAFIPGEFAQAPIQGIDFTSNQGGGKEAPWLRAYPDPEGFGRSLCSAAAWDRLNGFWYVIDRRAISETAMAHRLFKCGEWMDTDAIEIATLPLNASEVVKDLLCVEVSNRNGGKRNVLVMRIGRATFPTTLNNWGDRLCWMETTGGGLTQFHQFSYPRVVSGTTEVIRDFCWSMCVGGKGSEQVVATRDDIVFGLVDREWWSEGDERRRQQGITDWLWSAGSQTFSGGTFGGILRGRVNDIGTQQFIEGRYWKRISWNPYLKNGGGGVMFPHLTLAHPGGSYGNGSVVVTEASIRYNAGFDNTGTNTLYRLPPGPANSFDEDFNDIRSGVYPSQCWVDMDGQFLFVNMTGGVGPLDELHQPRNWRQMERDLIGIFAYAPMDWPNVGDPTWQNHNNFRVHLSGRPGINSTTLPYVYQEKLVLGPGCY